MNKTNTFKPFSNHGLILTDAHANEFNIENDTAEISIYGQWQGKIQSPTFQELVGALLSIEVALVSHKDKKSLEKQEAKIQISKKKDEISIDLDLHITQDVNSLLNIQNLLAKIEAVQTKTKKP